MHDTQNLQKQTVPANQGKHVLPLAWQLSMLRTYVRPGVSHTEPLHYNKPSCSNSAKGYGQLCPDSAPQKTVLMHGHAEISHSDMAARVAVLPKFPAKVHV
jgi:hypothetical protein